MICFTSLSGANDSLRFFSKIYLPCNWGISTSFNPNIKNGYLFKTGVEYRFKSEKGLFIQANIDNHTNKFSNYRNRITNVNDGVFRFNEYTVGLGNRFGKKKIKTYAFFHGGMSLLNYPLVSSNSSRILVAEQSSSSFILKSSFGLEYYIFENFCLLLGVDYSYMPGSKDVYGNNSQFLSFSFGLSTKLF